MENVFHPQKLTKELQEAKLPVAGVASTGRVDYTRELTKSEVAAAKAVIDAHDAGMADSEITRNAIASAGISIEDLVMALWAQAVGEGGQELTKLAQKIDDALTGV